MINQVSRHSKGSNRNGVEVAVEAKATRREWRNAQRTQRALLHLLHPATAPPQPSKSPPPSTHTTARHATTTKKAFPKAMRPSSRKVLGYAAWGAPVVATLLYMTQPFDFVKETLGLKEKSNAH